MELVSEQEVSPKVSARAAVVLAVPALLAVPAVLLVGKQMSEISVGV